MFVPSAFDLIGGGCRTPDEILGEYDLGCHVWIPLLCMNCIFNLKRILLFTHHIPECQMCCTFYTFARSSLMAFSFSGGSRSGMNSDIWLRDISLPICTMGLSIMSPK